MCGVKLFYSQRTAAVMVAEMNVHKLQGLVVTRVHNIYTERECPTLHMLCTNTLRKVMMQQPLTAKVLIKLKPYATLKG